MRKYTNEYANEHTHSTYMNVSLNNFNTIMEKHSSVPV